MYNSSLENKLIIVDIADVMSDHVSIQIDIDETKIKAAAIVAQNIDIKRILKQDNLDRCISPQDESDEELKALVVPALCYFTYSRCLKMFQGTFTDSGYIVEAEAEARNASKSVANEMFSIGEAFLQDAIDFLGEDEEATQPEVENMTPRVRIFGGGENRASN